MSKKHVFTSVVLFVSLSLVASDDLNSLLQKCPLDTAAFIATSGTDNFREQFDNSIPGRIAADPQVQTFFEQLFSALLKQQDVNDITVSDVYLDFAKEVLRSPCILAFSGDSSESCKAFFLSKTATDKDLLRTLLESAMKSLINSGKITQQAVAGNIVYSGSIPNCDNFYAAQTNDYFVAAINDADYAFLNNLAQASANNELAAVLGEVSMPVNALVYYFDFQKVISNCEKQEGADFDEFKKVLQSFGLYEAKYCLAKAGFEGKNLLLQGKLKSPTSQGLWTVLNSADKSLFQYVDGRAMQAGVISVNAAQLYDNVLYTISQTDPNAQQKVKTAINDAEAKIGFKIREDFISNLEGSFMGYVLPAYANPELMSGGYVLAGRLKDAQKVSACLNSLGKFVQSIADGQVQVSTQQTAEGKQINIWAVSVMAMMQIIPSWAIEGDMLIFTSHPSLTKNVVAQIAGAGKDSITANYQFASLINSVPSDAVAIGVADSKTCARQFMQMLQRFWPMLNMGMMNEGIQLPIMLPSIEPYIEQMEPGIKYARKTYDGMEFYYRGTGLEISSGGTAGGAMGLAILMPALSQTKRVAQRVVAGTNLKAIGTASIVYANDHDGKYPDDLDVLIAECDLSPESLVSSRKPTNFRGPSYILIKGLTSAAPAELVLAYENPVFCKDGLVNVLYADGHTSALDKPQLKVELKETYEYLKRPVPNLDW